MSRRSFIFCDVCNASAIRVVEMRRGGRGRDTRMGRRIIDGRAWFDGDEAQAQAHGWFSHPDGLHVCPICATRIRQMPVEMHNRVALPEAILDALLQSAPHPG